jgi:hypothetical protein
VWLAAAVAVAYAAVAGQFATFSRPAEVATFVPGLLAVIVALRTVQPGRAARGRRRTGWAWWWLVAAAFTAVELLALFLGANHAHPTVSDLVNPWLGPTPTRAAAFALWLAFGWWLVRR